MVHKIRYILITDVGKIDINKCVCECVCVWCACGVCVWCACCMSVVCVCVVCV
jgi:hypothetical protein